MFDNLSFKDPRFDFDAAFGESIPDDKVWGVWVGEHGFLIAVFRDKKDAESYLESLPYRDKSMDSIDIVQ